MKIKLKFKAKWEIIEPGECHQLMIDGFNRCLAEIDLAYGWWLYPHPNSFTSIAEGKCCLIKDGKRQIKEKLIELGMI